MGQVPKYHLLAFLAKSNFLVLLAHMGQVPKSHFFVMFKDVNMQHPKSHFFVLLPHMQKVPKSHLIVLLAHMRQVPKSHLLGLFAYICDNQSFTLLFCSHICNKYQKSHFTFSARTYAKQTKISLYCSACT